MMFNIKKPSNIIALILLLFSFYVLFIDSVLVYINASSLTDLLDLDNLNFIVFVTIFVLALTPFVWYMFVCKNSFKETLGKLGLHAQDIDVAFVWGLIASIGMLIIAILFSFAFVILPGNNEESLQSVNEIAASLSLFSVLILFIQTIVAEIYFRGFILSRIKFFAGNEAAVILSSVFYGVIYLPYGGVYPAILPIFLGLILGYVVIKTKSLYSAIFAQIFFNVIVYTLNYFAQLLV